MITIKRKRFLRRKLVIKRNSWDECSQDELLELFRVLQSPWYGLENRTNIAEFIDAPDKTQKFPIKNYKNLHGPREMLRGMTFGQWAYLEHKMFDLNQERSKRNISLFLACLYLPKKKKSLVFTSETATANEHLFDKVTPQFINASIRSWDGIRKWVYSIYPYVFPKSETAVITPEKPSAPEYVKIMRKMAGGVADIDIEKIFNSNVHSILSALNDELKPRRK